MTPFEHTQLGVWFSQGLAVLRWGNYNTMHCAECSTSKQNSLLVTPSRDGQNGSSLTATIWRAVEGEHALPQRRGDERRYTDIRQREEMERGERTGQLRKPVGGGRCGRSLAGWKPGRVQAFAPSSLRLRLRRS